MKTSGKGDLDGTRRAPERGLNLEKRVIAVLYMDASARNRADASFGIRRELMELGEKDCTE